jgi:Calcineurin-like phosphoesterase
LTHFLTEKTIFIFYSYNIMSDNKKIIPKCYLIDHEVNDYSDKIILENDEEYKTILIDDDIDSNDCESISVVNSKQKNNSIIRTCDIIKGRLERHKPDINPDKVPLILSNSTLHFELNYKGGTITSNDLVQFTNINGAKKASFKSINFTNITDNMKKLYDYENSISIINNVLNKVKNDHPNQSQFTEKVGYVRWLQPREEDNIILLGDIHGSFSTFVRHLLRWRRLNIINKNGIINGDYYIIFLGDIVDRGVYSYETLIILYLLKIKNPEKIILNRGNHEEMETNEYYNLKDEVVEKFKDYGKSIFIALNRVMMWQPSAIIVQNPGNLDEYVYLAHGGLPHDFDDNNRLPDQFINGVMNKESFIIDDEIAKGIRWNDIYGKEDTIDNLRRINPRNNPKITPENTPAFKTIKIIGKKIIKAANSLGIKMIIRGHQDSFHSIKVIGNNDREWFSIKEYTLQKEKKNNVQCYGPIYMVSIEDNQIIINEDNEMPFNLLPVLTISTNTDKDRNLTSDSYIVLLFSYKKWKNMCFTEDEINKKKFYKYNTKLLSLFKEIET